jgi:hypothetical protein
MLLLCSCILLFSCESNGRKDTLRAPEVKRDSVRIVPPVISRPDNHFNNVSAVISGIAEEGNPLSALLDSAAWSKNKQFMDESWKKLQTSRLDKISAWTAKELKVSADTSVPVFYPFSGPDFITAATLFPAGKTFIMLGLEPVGALPDVKKFSPQEAEDYTASLRHSLTDIFEKSYFITQYMLRDFQRQKVNGTLPVLCFFMKRSGHQVLDVKYLVKKNNDTIMEEGYDTKNKPFGVKIVCSKDNLVKNVYYFKYDVSNKQFADSNVFYRFVNSRTRGAATFVKSASYLLHANFMSNLKKLILRNSHYILEDDTGIPYDAIKKEGTFNLKLYGQYSRPVKNFPYLRMQKGIMDAYEKDSLSVPPLPFHLGYHWETGKDVLIYAEKTVK